MVKPFRSDTWTPPRTWTENCNAWDEAKDGLDFNLAGATGLEYPMTEDMGVTFGALLPAAHTM